MCITSLKVNMLGGLSIQSGGAEINDSDNRSRKVWLLLAYMIYCRKRPVTQEELVRLLWDDGDNVTNPANALKTMFHRVRTTLDRLGDSAGHILIVRQGGSYAWNCKVPLTLDVEEFDELCQAASDATLPKERLERYLKALELYNGDFLAHFSSDPWVVPVAAYYHNIYLQVVHEVLPMLEEADRREEAALLCRQAIQLDPYCEELYWHLMRNLLDLERQKEAIVVYEEVTQLLYDNFGVNPSDELRALYREAMSSVSDQPCPCRRSRSGSPRPTGPGGHGLPVRFLPHPVPDAVPFSRPQRRRGAHRPHLRPGGGQRAPAQAQPEPGHEKPAGPDPLQPAPGGRGGPVQRVPVHPDAAPGQL